jgi:hypothetical protein
MSISKLEWFIIALVIIIILIAAIGGKNLVSNDMFKFIFIIMGVFIAYDYIKLRLKAQKVNCQLKKLIGKESMTNNEESSNEDETPEKPTLEEDPKHEEKSSSVIPPDGPSKFITQGDSAITIPVPYSTKEGKKNVDDIFEMHTQMNREILNHNDMGAYGDNFIFNRMKFMQQQAKMSQDIRATFNVNSLKPYFEDELRECEERDWWDNDNLGKIM